MMEQCLREMTELTPQLYLSAVSAITDANLTSNRITLIVNATKELPLFLPKNPSIASVRVPVYDSCDEQLYPYFQPICDLIEANENRGGSTLVHCVAGRSRSASLCIAYLLWKDGSKLTLYDLLNSVQRKRSIVQPNMAFMGQLVSWEQKLKGIKPKLNCEVTDKEKQAINDIARVTLRIKAC